MNGAIKAPPEVVSVSSDEAVVLREGSWTTYRGLDASTSYVLDGAPVTTLARPGERLATVATTNDVHFGEQVCGMVEGADMGPVFSVPDGAEGYPEMMSRHGVAEIAEHQPDAVVVKGDLTADGTEEQYRAFLGCYGAAFGDRLLHVRGNHDCYRYQQFAATPFQEIAVPGALVALLDTCRPGRVNGELHAEQLDALDELGARADRPVIVLGHHPIWDARIEPRHDEVFGLLPASTEALVAVMTRRPALVTYAAGHTHRTHVVEIGAVPYVEVASLKEFPGAWCEYQIFDGGILQVVRRVRHPEALAWSERTAAMYQGAFRPYAYGDLAERCRLLRLRTGRGAPRRTAAR